MGGNHLVEAGEFVVDGFFANAVFARPCCCKSEQTRAWAVLLDSHPLQILPDSELQFGDAHMERTPAFFVLTQDELLAVGEPDDDTPDVRVCQEPPHPALKRVSRGAIASPR